MADLPSNQKLSVESCGGRTITFELDEDGELVVGIGEGDTYDDFLLSVPDIQRLRKWLRPAGETNGDARHTAEYWKAEHLAGNAEIDRLQGELREARLEIARVAAEGLRAIGKAIETTTEQEPLT